MVSVLGERVCPESAIVVSSIHFSAALLVHCDLPRDKVIPQFGRASSINILAVGGGTNLFWQAGDFSYISSASVDKWR